LTSDDGTCGDLGAGEKLGRGGGEFVRAVPPRMQFAYYVNHSRDIKLTLVPLAQYLEQLFGVSRKTRKMRIP
jgi:hypothetical protein